jgi:hypothetical protein
MITMLLSLSVSDRAGSARRRAFCLFATTWIAPLVAVVVVLASPVSADPLSTPPLGGEEHGQFFRSLQLLDPVTAALPPLPARVPATPFKPENGSAPQPPTGPVADSWMWQLTADSLALPHEGSPPVRETPPASGWARIVAKTTPILLAAGAVMTLAVLMSLTQRR